MQHSKVYLRSHISQDYDGHIILLGKLDRLTVNAGNCYVSLIYVIDPCNIAVLQFPLSRTLVKPN